MRYDRPTIHVTLEVEVELVDKYGFCAEPEQIGNGLTDTLMDVAPYILLDGERWRVTSVGFEANPITCWYIGPESKVYHTNHLCTALNRDDRHWPVQGATEPPKRRRLCQICARGGANA